jgi:2-keto-3-deoxy-L-rhamnonate aldolase RhmA
MLVDQEHSSIDDRTRMQTPGALDSRDRPDRSRPEARPLLIGQALDAGAAGVIVPAAGDRATGEAVARAVRYPPEGGGA